MSEGMASFQIPRILAETSSPGLPAGLRLEVSVDVSTYLSGTLTPVRLKHLSAGGCLIDCTVALTPGSIQQLRFTMTAGKVITLIGRIGAARRPILGPATSWVVECVFAHAGTLSVQSQISELMSDVALARRVA